ncbi:MFS transporter [Dactylosporangium matsuzakiense]|uniref:MFS transporter n=1 Tax=Dactylosporangium matsuzakiense TaxID=53360 RepID=A0A9W6KTF0_9ACTN|nr:MFS transporter [Dactylosporangium matsuzakiense]GLL06364.1 MFS transporter [Dactylosporangium matsuzakiense]
MPSSRMDATAKRAVAVTCILMFLTSLDVTIVNVALPAIRHGLDVSTGSLGWTVEAYAIPFATLMLSGGALTDRLGPARAFVTGIVVFGLGSLLCAVAPVFWLLAAGRLVQGVGAAVCMPSALAVLRSGVGLAHLGRAVALWAFSGSVAISMGPILGGTLVQYSSWRTIFVVNIPVVVAAVLLLLPALRAGGERPAAAGRTADATGQAVYVAGSGLLVGGLLLFNAESDSARWRMPVLLLVLGAAAFAAFYACERRAAHPVLPASLMRNPAFQSAAIVGGSVNVVNFGLLYCLGLYYGGQHGFTALKSGLLFLPMMLGTGVSTLVVERIRKVAGDRVTVLTGLALELAGAVLIGVRPESASWVSAATAGIGFGVGLVIPPITTGLLSAVEPGVSGVAGGAFSSIRQLGSALGVAVLGLLVSDAGGAVRVPLRPIGAVCAALLVVALVTYLVSSALRARARPEPVAAGVAQEAP